MTDEEKQYIQSLMKKKSGGTAKLFTISIVGIILLVGAIGSFENSFIDMDSFISFLKAYSPILISLIGSVGVGYGVKHIKEVVKAKNEK
jgi:hypothetical protein